MWILSLIKNMLTNKMSSKSKTQVNDDSRCNMAKDISSDKNFKRILVIGDIHGHYKKFISLYKKLEVTDDDLVIYLGDYIDRGPVGETAYVLDFMMHEVEKDNVIALRGNHEQMMLDFFNNGDFNWLFNGGDKTGADIKSKMKEDPDYMSKVMEFADSRPLSHRMMIDGKDYFFCHAGVKPGVSLEEQTSESLLWIRDEFINNYDGESIIVVGHTPLVLLKPEGSLEMWRRDYQDILEVKNVKPQWRRNNKILMMDTGSYFLNGCISCMDIKSGKLWKSD